MANCAVALCKNYLRKTKNNKEVIYHKFPKQITICKVWVEKCKRKDKFNPNNSSVCSEHFSEDSYERDLKSELLGLPPRKKLKPDAVPNEKLPNKIHVETDNSKHERLVARNIRKRALSPPRILKCPKKARNNEDQVVHEQHVQALSDQFSESDSSDIQVSNCKSVIQKLEQEIVELKVTVSDLQNENKDTKKLEHEIIKLKSTVSNLQKEKAVLLKKLNGTVKRNQDQIQKLRGKLLITKKQINAQKKAEKTVIKHNLTDSLGKMLSKNQIDFMLSGKKKKRWNNADMAGAFALRAISKKAYVFLRNIIHFPLPGLTTMQRWVSQLKCLPGLQVETLQLMEHARQQMTTMNTFAALSFDEMNVNAVAEYDKQEDCIYGPCSNVQCMMLRGIAGKWKQPIYYQFDKQVNAELLNSVITACEEGGYPIVAIVSDLGGKNQLVWKELKVTPENPWFINPVDLNRKVWVFADVPHLLKLLRNWFLDAGFTLASGKVLTKRVLNKILGKNEFQLCPKLADDLTVKCRDRQRVLPAVRLFSRRTSKALSFICPEEIEAIELFQLTNDFYDVMNSRNATDHLTPLRSGYKVDSVEQNEVLDYMLDVIVQLRVTGKKSLLPFQRGIVQSINALRGVAKYLKEKGQMNYVLTARLNQDCLENLFSQIRGLGHTYDHPSPVEVKRRLRHIIVASI